MPMHFLTVGIIISDTFATSTHARLEEIEFISSYRSVVSKNCSINSWQWCSHS